jgi:hypothetical protein
VVLAAAEAAVLLMEKIEEVEVVILLLVPLVAEVGEEWDLLQALVVELVVELLELEQV